MPGEPREQRTLAVLPAGREQVHVNDTVNDKGEPRVDIRKFYFDHEEKEWKATKKGINVSHDEWPRFLQMLNEVDYQLNPPVA